MAEQLIIFGSGQMAEVAYARFRRDSRYEIAGFTVDRSHLHRSSMFGLRVVPFEDVESEYAPSSVRMFIAVGPIQNNRIRADRFLQAQRMGYGFVNYVSPHAIVDPDVELGENCSVGENAIVQAYARIGDNVRIGSASVVGHHCELTDHCYLAVNCILAGSVHIGARAFLGAAATIRDGVSIGEGCVIGAGATIVRDTAPGTVHVAPDSIQLSISADRMNL
jgi:sugar O-acyltransferase (sialic acid O-acetyltransferase NeuD family)